MQGHPELGFVPAAHVIGKELKHSLLLLWQNRGGGNCNRHLANPRPGV